MNANSPTKKLTSKKNRKPAVRFHKDETINSLLTATAAHWKLPVKQNSTSNKNKN